MLGVGVLVLDADSARPLLPAGVPPVAALCATNPDAVFHAIQNWRDPRKKDQVDLVAVREDLVTIRSLPGFNAFLAKLRKELSEPVWLLVVRRQNRKLADQIRNNSSTLFRVPYKQGPSVIA